MSFLGVAAAGGGRVPAPAAAPAPAPSALHAPLSSSLFRAAGSPLPLVLPTADRPTAAAGFDLPPQSPPQRSLSAAAGGAPAFALLTSPLRSPSQQSASGVSAAGQLSAAGRWTPTLRSPSSRGSAAHTPRSSTDRFIPNRGAYESGTPRGSMQLTPQQTAHIASSGGSSGASGAGSAAGAAAASATAAATAAAAQASAQAAAAAVAAGLARGGVAGAAAAAARGSVAGAVLEPGVATSAAEAAVLSMMLSGAAADVASSLATSTGAGSRAAAAGAAATATGVPVTPTPKENSVPNANSFHAALARNLFGSETACMLPVQTPGRADDALSPLDRHVRAMEAVASAASPLRRPVRPIPTVPDRVLDAPSLVDDYYLNLLDWSSSNVLGVALGRSVYLWNATTEESQLLCTVPSNDIVSSLAFSHDGSCLAVGLNSTEVHLYDVGRLRRVRAMPGHQGRVSALSWNMHIVSSGGRDASIVHNDVRCADPRVGVMDGHSQEVCGLKWNTADGTTLASGGNDNLLNVWDFRMREPRYTFDAHTAAVKALAWSPFQSSLLASGGGTADRTIRFWNTSTGACLQTIDTKSQVCALQWSKHSRELVSSHGFSQNEIVVWKWPSMQRLASLTGHTSRVLHLALSPDGTTVCSAAGDETLRFWRVWPAKSGGDDRHAGAGRLTSVTIR